jgi:hypothetical protein
MPSFIARFLPGTKTAQIVDAEDGLPLVSDTDGSVIQVDLGEAIAEAAVAEQSQFTAVAGELLVVEDPKVKQLEEQVAALLAEKTERDEQDRLAAEAAEQARVAKIEADAAKWAESLVTSSKAFPYQASALVELYRASAAADHESPIEGSSRVEMLAGIVSHAQEHPLASKTIRSDADLPEGVARLEHRKPPAAESSNIDHDKLGKLTSHTELGGSKTFSDQRVKERAASILGKSAQASR